MRYVEGIERPRTKLGTFFISLIMDVQDFLIQGEGREEDKREAWLLFQQAYERQMKGELEGTKQKLVQSVADVATALRSSLRHRHALFVLDNMEHLLGAVPDLAQLLLSCPRLQLLSTSRAPLRLRGEQESGDQHQDDGQAAHGWHEWSPSVGVSVGEPPSARPVGENAVTPGG